MLEVSRSGSSPRRTVAPFAGLLLALFAGCPGELPEPVSKYMAAGTATDAGTGGAGGAACDAPAKVFRFGAIPCSNAACHDPASNDPDLSSADPSVALIGKNAISGMGIACVGMPYVIAGNPPTGVLMQRVSGTTCGPLTQMPLVGAMLTPEQITCLTSWLSSKL